MVSILRKADWERQTQCSKVVVDGVGDFFSESETMQRKKSEKERLDTFRNWPSSSYQTPKSLAKAGFYYTGISDRVQCAFCHGVLKNWLPSDEPMSEHKLHFPSCPFVKGEYVGNIPMAEDMQIEENRLASFSAWPRDRRQTPNELARAGFYYLGDSFKPDRVKCAYCQVRLYDWMPGDDPWIEHARAFPRCPYTKLCLGQDFIDDILKSGTEPHQSNRAVFTPQSSQNSASQNTPNNVEVGNQTVNYENRRSESGVRKAANSSQVQAMLEMGYPRDLVQNAVEWKIRETGTGFASAADLAAHLLEMEAETSTVSPSSSQVSVTNQTAPQLYNPSQQSTSTSEQQSTPASEQQSSSLSTLQERYLCKVCMENQLQMTFLPCGHLVCCGQCALSLEVCPICRTGITGMVKTYY